MIIWYSLVYKRYSVAYAFNQLESQAKGGVLDIPLCQEPYRNVRARLVESRSIRFLDTLIPTVDTFKTCISKNYPELYKKFKELEEEARINYKNEIHPKSRREKIDIILNESDMIYYRAARRMERGEMRRKQEEEKAGKEYKPSKKMRQFEELRNIEESVGIRQLKDSKIF